ncbi:uncharacterized protein TNCV_3461331 [Trichonephila clavipes]|nr:uncharacterized protein TNCV_3461331 [Trichonephila clavipes]
MHWRHRIFMLSIKLSVTEDQTRSKLSSNSLKDLGGGLIYIKQQPVYQDSPKDALSDISLEIELVISFSPNQDLKDIPQQLQFGQCDHRVRSLHKPLFHHLGNCVFQQCWIDDICVMLLSLQLSRRPDSLSSMNLDSSVKSTEAV